MLDESYCTLDEIHIMIISYYGSTLQHLLNCVAVTVTHCNEVLYASSSFAIQ